jgi:hypothetical protein
MKNRPPCPFCIPGKNNSLIPGNLLGYRGLHYTVLLLQKKSPERAIKTNKFSLKCSAGNAHVQ